jgi:hypothetical protein
MIAAREVALSSWIRAGIRTPSRCERRRVFMGAAVATMVERDFFFRAREQGELASTSRIARPATTASSSEHLLVGERATG